MSDLAAFAEELFGEGAHTVIAEYDALYNALTPEQQRVSERFIDMIATGLKVGFTQMDAARNNDGLYFEGYQISVAANFLRRGASQDDVKRILGQAAKDAEAHAAKGVWAVPPTTDGD